MEYILLSLILTTITKTVHISKDELSFSIIKGYQVPTLKECNFIPNPGEPCLPVKAVYFLLPEGTKVKEVSVGTTQELTLPGRYDIYPAQPPQILGIPGFKLEAPKFVGPNPNVYESTTPYPGKIIEFVGEGNFRGYRIAEILVHPLQWIPKTKELKLYTEIEINVELTKDVLYQKKCGNTRIGNLIKSFIINPENFTESKNYQLPHDGYEYLIITNNRVASEFEHLANWKSSKGIPATVRTTSWIATNYDGDDLAEKIRNFIKVAAHDSGVIWVLLGGDTPIVPARVAYAMTSKGRLAVDEDSIRADLYYSDLDGSWDTNNNHIYGEVEDSVDLYPDVFVGRAPINNIAQVRTFVNKVITYEQNPPPDYLNKVLFMAEVLWRNPYTDAGIAKNMIGKLFPSNFVIQKLYQSIGNESRNSVIEAMNTGKGLLNHDGHAWYTVMCVGEGRLICGDMDNLINKNKQGILYSIGCWPAAFDYDCIAEHWVLNPNGGGVAFIGNSRYGWGAPGNPGYGYSDKMDERFFYNLFKENITHIGVTLAKTKVDYIAYSRNANVWRWHQYQINLLGEPEMKIWTDKPRSLEASYPDSISVGANVFKVSTEVEGTLVCCSKEDEVYVRGYTNSVGSIKFDIHPVSPGDLQVCVTYPNHLPHQGIVKVHSTGAYPGYYKHTIIDSNGNDEVNPNETIDLLITLKNYGNQPANNVTATFTTADFFVTILDSTGDFGDIPVNGTAQSSFKFRVGDCPQDHIIMCKLEIAEFGKFGLNFSVKMPQLMYEYYAIPSTIGVPKPGDTVELWLTIRNKGGIAPNAECKIRSADPQLTLLDTIKNFGDMGSNSVISRPYKIYIRQSCPSIHFASIILELTSSIYSCIDTLLLSIGRVETSFFDNFETNVPGWRHGGVEDLWTLTDHRRHSCTRSWYCGNPTVWEYHDSMDCWLQSPYIILGPNSWLSFWSWFNVAIYSAPGHKGDGIYPIIKRVASWKEDTLDFIGCGGALRNFTVDWAEYLYDLSSYPVGCTLQVKFGFISDDRDVAEGFYIDDVRIGELETLHNLWLAFWSTNDSLGNNDGIIDPGETTFVYVWLINEGTTPIFNAIGNMSCTDPYITLLPWEELEFGDILGRRVTKGFFSFVASTSTPIGNVIYFNLRVDKWNLGIYIPVGVEVEKGEKIVRPSLICLPNPFKKYATIRYQVPPIGESVPVSIKIYDVTGRILETLVDKEMKPGSYHIHWDTQGMTNGIYFVKLEYPGDKSTKKLILLR